MCPPVRLIAWLSGSGAHKDGAETPRRRRHVLGVAAQAARCSNAMRAINSSPTRGTSWPRGGSAWWSGSPARWRHPGYAAPDASRRQVRTTIGCEWAAANRCRQGNAREARAHEWWHWQCSYCADASGELSLRGEGTATARVAVPMGCPTKRPRAQCWGWRSRLPRRR